MTYNPSIRPAREYANLYGAKLLVHGVAGSGKTPLVNTAPNPLLLLTEPGTLSLRGSNVPAFEAYDGKTLEAVLEWMRGSREFGKYDTFAIDSVTQIAELYLKHAKEVLRISHGMQQYGYAAERTRAWVDFLYFLKGKNTYLIAKQAVLEVGGINQLRPFFPGKDLNTYIPHLFDLILCLGEFVVPSVGVTKAFKCQGSADILARDRTGKLAEYEPANLSYIIQKVTAA